MIKLKKIILIISAIIILGISAYSVLDDPELRYFAGKMSGLKDMPDLSSKNFTIEEVVVGINSSTALTFVNGDILFLEKETGQIRQIENGQLLETPVWDFNVKKEGCECYTESGLLGITTKDNLVYIYVSEPLDEEGKIPKANNIYEFLWTGDELVNKKLINTLPSRNCCHQGGYMVTSPNGEIFATIGDLENIRESGIPSKLQNNEDGGVDDTSIILRVGIDENTISPMTSDDPFSHYYAIGIRNSFGLAFDPITGNLWDTENGQVCCDEINLVTENFNSGWALVQGMANENSISVIPKIENFEYSNPEFTWDQVNAPTALAIPGNNWGEKYQNSLFVSDYIFGKIYKFELNDSRDGFVFQDPSLQDLIFHEGDNSDEIIFATEFGRISDMKFGPDGSLYVASHLSNGALFKISME